MPIPSTRDIKLPLLRHLSKVEVAKISDIYDDLAKLFNLTPEDLTELYPSGSDYVFKNRVRWARQHLVDERLARSPGHSLLEITDQGRELLKKSAGTSRKSDIRESSDNPEEAIEYALSEITKKLKQNLLYHIKQQPWQFFEQLVIDLLLKMGYGGTRKEAGIAFQSNNDGGVDGLINEDVLGLDKIYVQAKKWKDPVGRREIQNFLGALSTKNADTGIFITTSKYNSNAIECAKVSDKKIVLIDGNQLTSFMIEYNVGINVSKNFEIKRIDSDYFSLE